MGIPPTGQPTCLLSGNEGRADLDAVHDGLHVGTVGPALVSKHDAIDRLTHGGGPDYGLHHGPLAGKTLGLTGMEIAPEIVQNPQIPNRRAVGENQIDAQVFTGQCLRRAQ